MSINKPELSFEIVYYDEDLIEVEVKASNGRYAGVTVVYTDGEGKELIELGEQLQGFPKDIGQVIEQKFGYTKEELIDYQEKILGRIAEITHNPYLNLKFRCIDNSGHTAVDIFLIEDNWTTREEARGKVSFELLFEPASLDQFSVELSELGRNREGKATLIGSLDNKNSYF